jgi:enolase
MILPTGVSSFAEAMRAGTEVYHHLKAVIKKKHGVDSVNVGDEGGFAPPLRSGEEALELLVEAIAKAGYTGKVKIGMDVAASEFHTADGRYNLNKKVPGDDGSGALSKDALLALYADWCARYPIVSAEDTHDQDDVEGWTAITAKLGEGVQLVGDDLLVTNPLRVKRGIEGRWCNALLLKINQIGSISEAIKAVQMAQAAGWGVMASHRSGETEDAFIADLAVGLGCGQIKTGAPCRSERLAKYNQLLRIDEELGPERAVYAGDHFRTPAKAL